MKPIYGIVGHPVLHSLSPAMHTAALRAACIDAEYRIFDISPEDPEELANFCYETEIQGIAGFSVTMPYKEEIMNYMDHYDPLAKEVASVNTVKVEGNQLIGYNTDAQGAIAALREKTTLEDKKVLVLGAGGAARAAAYALHQFGARVFVWNRTYSEAEHMAKEYNLTPVPFDQIVQVPFDIYINATPVGMAPDITQTILKAEQIRKGSIVMDLITYPIETEFLRQAKKAGAQVIDGSRMLLHQAAGQFEIWFKKEAPLEVMEKALNEELKRRA